MLKITTDRFEEVPVNTDGVILIADDITPWPSLPQLMPLMDEMRLKLGRTCTKLVPELPMTQMLTTRWATDSLVSAEQAHQMFLTRFMFTAAASWYSMWPLSLITGEQGSAKSTAFELQLTLLTGKRTYGQSLPAKEDALYAIVTNKSFVSFDNIDGAGLDDPRKASVSDTLCHLATGAQIGMRRLFTTNQLDTFEVRNHASFTARVCPFSRSDVMRRCIHLDVAPPDGHKIVKETLLDSVVASRPALLAELILRAQNILRAHLEYGNKQYTYQTEMVEYEAFTLRCAEFEGSLAQTEGLWTAYMGKYQESISTGNPMVFAVRLWLGSEAKNQGREVSATTLFGEMRNVHEQLGQPFTYRAPSAFGGAVGKQISSLRVLGFDRRHGNTGTVYRFIPSELELQKCKLLFEDLREAQFNRPDKPLGSNFGRSKGYPGPSQEELDATYEALWPEEKKIIQ